MIEFINKATLRYTVDRPCIRSTVSQRNDISILEFFLNRFFLTYDTNARRFKFIVYIDIQGTTVPLVRASSIEASERFIRQAQTWKDWNWLLKLVHPSMQIKEIYRFLFIMPPYPDYDRITADYEDNVLEYCHVKISDITAPVNIFACPDDSVSLEDWTDSIFFGDSPTIEVVKRVPLTEYHSRDHVETYYAPVNSMEYPNIRISNAVVVVDFDGDWGAIEYNGIPTPSKIIINPANGHAHLWWLVNGVVKGKAVQWLDDITRGFTRRLKGDLGIHRYTKNPNYPGWHVIINDCTYELSELDAVLSKEDKKRVWSNNSFECVDGRNPRDFERYRHIAYAAPIVSAEDCEQYLLDMGQSLGYESTDSEFRNICRWIAKGVEKGKWPEYSQRGVPRRTYFYRKKHDAKKTVEKVCEHCKGVFDTNTKKAKFCSDRCRDGNRRKVDKVRHCSLTLAM